VPRDATFKSTVSHIIDLYTRALPSDEVVLCLDEKTSLQPRRRLRPTLPARPGLPVRVEQEYERQGALNLFAAFDTRSGTVIGQTTARKRATEFLAFLDQLDQAVPPTVTTIHLVLDNLRVHKGKAAQAWLAGHPRFRFHHPPVHCSWMNQVEQWFAILQRKALRVADFDGPPALASRIDAFIAHWNAHAHPFNWTTASIAKLMAPVELSRACHAA
jgi:transposase